MAGIDLGDAWADNVWEENVWANDVWAGQEDYPQGGGATGGGAVAAQARQQGVLMYLIRGMRLIVFLLPGVL